MFSKSYIKIWFHVQNVIFCLKYDFVKTMKLATYFVDTVI